VGFGTLALLLLQASKAHGRAQAVLSLGSAPRGNIVDRNEDALPLPVDVSKAEEAIFDQLRAGRTLGGTTGVSGDLKLYQDRQFENGPFSSWHPERKFAFLSVFFVSRAMTRGCKSPRRAPRQI
jgi:hypothetical protein